MGFQCEECLVGGSWGGGGAEQLKSRDPPVVKRAGGTVRWMEEELRVKIFACSVFDEICCKHFW